MVVTDDLRCANVYASYYIGQMSATGMMVATEKWDNELSWRLPLYIQVCVHALPLLHLLIDWCSGSVSLQASTCSSYSSAQNRESPFGLSFARKSPADRSW